MIGSVELIAEHLLLAHDLYRAQLAQVILVEVFQVAEDALGVFAVLDPLFLGGFEVGEGHVLDLFEDGFVAVFRYAQIFVGDLFPEHFVLDRTRGPQIGQYGFFGQFEGCFRFGHVVDDLIECVDGLGHFVVLRGDDRCEKIIVVQVARIDPLREGHVSQAAGFAHLL